MGKWKKFVGKVLMEDYLADLTTDGKTIFIDLIDVGCEGVIGCSWFRVEFVMNTAINMNEVKCFFSLCGGRGLDTDKLYVVLTCNKKYVGQTSRSLNLRYKEHVRYIKYNNP
jgi:hypothetical protein